MARSKQEQPDGSGTAEQSKGGRSFKAETGKFDSLKVGDSFTGFFMGAKWTEITDRRTKQPKKIYVLKLRGQAEKEEDAKVYKFPCAAMMLQTWEDIVDEYGNGDEEQAVQRLRGQKMTINRGEDSETRDGNELGTYEIIVWE